MTEEKYEEQFTAPEKNTILAALRYYQHEGMGVPDNRAGFIHDIATNLDSETSLDSDAIDALCIKINEHDGSHQTTASTVTNLSEATKTAVEALKCLEDLSLLVLRDITDQDTGWFYQFQGAAQKAGPAIVALAPTYPGHEKKSPNVNCLEGMRCPSCGSYGPFNIAAEVFLCAADDGATWEDGDSEWGDASCCRCHGCAHVGTVATFTEAR